MDKDTPVRVLVVDDTVTYRRIVSDALSGIPGVEVVGASSNGKIALQKMELLRPDMLTLDLEMPVMDGLEVLRRLRKVRSKVGVIMLSAFTARGAETTLEALKLGAFDYVLKPTDGAPRANIEKLRRRLEEKIEAFTKARRKYPSPTRAAPRSQRPVAPAPGRAAIADRMQRVVAGFAEKPEVVALGISTGGPTALSRMLPELPANLSVPILIVQHMPPIFTQSLANDLDRRCALHVCEAVDEQPIQAGTIYIAPGGKQMKVEQSDAVTVARITNDPPENSCRPSVDYLFRSVSEVYGPNAVGVIMTGMGTDGSSGCRRMKRKGSPIIAQDEASCVVYGMPREPVEEGVADIVAPLHHIAVEILRLVGKGVPACK